MYLILILSGLFLVCIGGALVGGSDKFDNFWAGLIGILLILGGGLMITLPVSTLFEQVDKKSEKVYYYEEFKVDPENIDLHNFIIIYDVDKDVYILTKKEN